MLWRNLVKKRCKSGGEVEGLKYPLPLVNGSLMTEEPKWEAPPETHNLGLASTISDSQSFISNDTATHLKHTVNICSVVRFGLLR